MYDFIHKCPFSYHFSVQPIYSTGMFSPDFFWIKVEPTINLLSGGCSPSESGICPWGSFRLFFLVIQKNLPWNILHPIITGEKVGPTKTTLTVRQTRVEPNPICLLFVQFHLDLFWHRGFLAQASQSRHEWHFLYKLERVWGQLLQHDSFARIPPAFVSPIFFLIEYN